jgi:hypothetical protein
MPKKKEETAGTKRSKIKVNKLDITKDLTAKDQKKIKGGADANMGIDANMGMDANMGKDAN